MKDAVDGANHLVLGSATCQTVTPSSPARSFGHFNIAPPHDSRGMPRCFWYHAARALWSFVLLKNTPPIPVTFAIPLPSRGSAFLAPLGRIDLVDDPPPSPNPKQGHVVRVPGLRIFLHDFGGRNVPRH